MRKPTVASLLTLTAVAAGWLVWVVVVDLRGLSRIDEDIDAQKQVKTEVLSGILELETQSDRLSEEMEALPDSIRMMRMGEVVKRSLGMDKQQRHLESRSRGADRMLSKLAEERRAITRHLRRWGLVLGLATGALGVASTIAILSGRRTSANV